jgi:Tol biopolymer transport system component
LYTNLGDTAGKGGANDKINTDIIGAGSVVEYDWAPTIPRLVYLADEMEGRFELYTADADGMNNLAVGGVTDVTIGGPDFDVLPGHFSWAPNSLLIAFVADGDLNDAFEMYVVHPTTAVRTRVSRIATAATMVLGPPSWAPNSSRIAYLGDLLADGTDELFTSIPTEATTSTRVNSDSAVVGGDVETGPLLSPPAWAPDSSRIAYTARQIIDQREVYSGLADGSGSSKLSGPLAMNGTTRLGADGEVWSPDKTTLTLSYRADQSLFARDELWAATATTNRQLTTSSMAATGLRSFALWAPDGSQVIYVSEEETAFQAELFMTSADGSTRQKISGNLISGGDVVPASIAWAP